MQQAPVAIAVSGKRNLRGEDDGVRRALAHAFDTLDAELPLVPKRLLTGLAVGADTLAVEQVLGRPLWAITAVLPLPLAVYLDDFPDPPGPGSPRKRLEAFLADRRIAVREMAPLRDPETGAPTVPAALHPPPAGSNPLRDQHYEQQGLWIADNAALLIAVKPAAELPGLVGGTARIIAYRLGGAPDATAREVIEASRELRLAAASRRGGAVWLIDAPGAPRRRTPAFQVLLPPPQEEETSGPDDFSRRLGLSLAAARALAAQDGGVG